MNPDGRIHPDISLELVDAILRGLQRAYESNQELQRVDYGHDEMSFGILVWKSGTQFIPEEVVGITGVAVSVENHSLEVKIGRCSLRPLKLGQSEFDDPWSSFPDHVGPAARMDPSIEQLHFEGIIFPTPISWVIGHYGNSTEGLRAVYLQAPSVDRSENGAIRAWRQVIKIYDASDQARPETARPPSEPLPVEIPDPDVFLRGIAAKDARGPQE